MKAPQNQAVKKYTILLLHSTQKIFLFTSAVHLNSNFYSTFLIGELLQGKFLPGILCKIVLL